MTVTYGHTELTLPLYSAVPSTLSTAVSAIPDWLQIRAAASTVRFIFTCQPYRLLEADGFNLCHWNQSDSQCVEAAQILIFKHAATVALRVMPRKWGYLKDSNYYLINARADADLVDLQALLYLSKLGSIIITNAFDNCFSMVPCQLSHVPRNMSALSLHIFQRRNT